MQPTTRPPAVLTPTALEPGLLVTGAVLGRVAAELTARYGGVFSPQTVTAVVADPYTRPRPRPVSRLTDNPGWKPRRSGRGGMPGPPDCRTGRETGRVSRFRLYPTPAQETALLGHCAQARFVWNLALEQANSYGTAGRKAPPNFAAQSRQLTEARAEHQWLAAGAISTRPGSISTAGACW